MLEGNYLPEEQHYEDFSSSLIILIIINLSF